MTNDLLEMESSLAVLDRMINIRGGLCMLGMGGILELGIKQ